MASNSCQFPSHENYKKPNILFILSDDHGYADRAHAGIHPTLHTPGLDRITAEGVECTDGYVSAPICSPSRAGIMTGQYQERWGSLWFDSAEFPSDPHISSLAEVLKSAGYRTGYFGKVHYGSEKVGDRGCPPHHGFDTTFYGLAGQSYGRLNYLHHSSNAQEEYGEQGAVVMAVQPMLDGDVPVEYEGFITDEFGRRARNFIADEDERPFFCMLAFNAVHNFCWQLPQEELTKRNLPAFRDFHSSDPCTYGQWYDDVIMPHLEHGRDYYIAQLELMDQQISAILDDLDKQGIADNTLVVYITDNGGSTCNYGDNAPLRGTKYTLWEGGIRVPMLWRWPAALPAGKKCAQLASSLDLMPTFRAIAGLQPDPHSDGINLLPILTGNESTQRTLHWDHGFQFAVRNGKWKLSWVDSTSDDVQALKREEHAPMGEGLFLADLENDISERHNCANEKPDVVKALWAAHEQWCAEVGIRAHGECPMK